MMGQAKKSAPGREARSALQSIASANDTTVQELERAKLTTPGSTEWADLDTIPDEVEQEPNKFPMDALGPIIGTAAESIAHDVQAPDVLVAGSLLAGASLVTQPHANVVFPHGQRAPLSLYIVTGALSGDRKSAVDEVACHEINEARKADTRDYMRRVDEYEASKASGDKTSDPPKPRSLTTGNATVEGLVSLLRNQSSVGVFSSDGGDFLGGHSFRDERKAAGFAFYLKMWGGEDASSMRAGSGFTGLLGRRLALHVLVQPVLLTNLLADPLARQQGLIARCLVAQPHTLAGQRMYLGANALDSPDVQRFHQAVRALLDRNPTCWGEGDTWELKPRDLPMAPDATNAWVEFYNQIESAQADGKELAGARAFASKAAEHAARVAGVLTLIENPDAPSIPFAAMRGAIRIVNFYMKEHLRLTGTAKEATHLQNLRTLWEWLRGKGYIPARDILRLGPRKCGARKAETLTPLLIDLQQRAYIRDFEDGYEVRNV